MPPKRRRARSLIVQGSHYAGNRLKDWLGRDSFSLALDLPGLDPEIPLCHLKIEMQSEPLAQGGRVRFRAHLQARIASALAPALSKPSHAQIEQSLSSSSGLRERVRAALSALPAAGAARALLQKEFNSWLEIRTSTADLLDGAKALLPEHEHLKALGIDAADLGEGVLAQTWSGVTGGSAPSAAQVSLLQLDKRHLPKSFAALLGTQPFQLAAAWINVVEVADPKRD